MCEHFAQCSGSGFERYRHHKWSGLVWLFEGLRETSRLHCLSIHPQLCQRYCTQKHVGREDRFRILQLLFRSRRVFSWGSDDSVWCRSFGQSEYSITRKLLLSVCRFGVPNMPSIVSCLGRHDFRRCFGSILADLLRRQHGFFCRCFRERRTSRGHAGLYGLL